MRGQQCIFLACPGVCGFRRSRGLIAWGNATPNTRVQKVFVMNMLNINADLIERVQEGRKEGRVWLKRYDS